ncbi:hypothetical protein HHK36_031970 [Tetracentron sinense]|uniref:Uncharacterized protein n=1 Tax=Tetracentron sinense TaxID=13715 RepID=A0A834Y682_TETSI|nr:hypothetical protein HHK36_031970 [Tetracentron sinense]
MTGEVEPLERVEVATREGDRDTDRWQGTSTAIKGLRELRFDVTKAIREMSFEPDPERSSIIEKGFVKPETLVR